jgi:5-hydroxyisourate hydrolase-like protein (transthyretin family)
MRMLNNTTFILLILFATSSFGSKKQSSAMHYGEISGVVLTEEGLPAVDFKVCTQVHAKQSWVNTIQTCCSAKTNSEGRFTIKDLKPGKYELLASNDAEGYSIGNQTPGLVVVINESKSQPNVTIRLHNRGAVVVAHIADKTTGKPLDDVHLAYSGVDCEAGGDVLAGVQGEYSVPIPIDCDVTLIARAKGYKGWVYTDAESPSRPVLRLAAGQRKILDIQLEPTGDQLSQR